MVVAGASLLGTVAALGLTALFTWASTPAHSLLGGICQPNLPAGGTTKPASIILRYRAASGPFVILEISPYEVGPNVFEVTLADGSGPVQAPGRLRVGFRRLEDSAPAVWLEASEVAGRLAYRASSELNAPGWWVVEVNVGSGPPVPFVLRLDEPSGAPLKFKPPDYPSDPEAERLFWATVQIHRELTAVAWEEQLTSGLAYPAGRGAWVWVAGRVHAPDRYALRVVNPDRESYEVVQAGNRRCTRSDGGDWVCGSAVDRNPLDLSLLGRSYGFRLGRQEVLDGELTRVVTFYEPTEQNWYAWWVGVDTGYLRRMAMVGPGHFMVTRYFDHNLPVNPSSPALPSGFYSPSKPESPDVGHDF